jgi:hypothetical protein
MSDTLEVLVIEPGGEIYDETIPSGCEALQKLVGGWIECPPSDDNRISLFINEEGKLIGLEPNMLGTAVWHAVTPMMRGIDDLCGTVVITGGVDDEGNTMSIPRDMRDAIVRALTNLSDVLA